MNQEEKMHKPISRYIMQFIPFLFASHAIPAMAQIDCATLPHWVKLDNGLQLNQQHVFCGEWTHNRPKGFHARPQGMNPTSVAQFTVQSQPNAAGIYTGRWSHQKDPGKNKFSSMFPDHCSTEQILHSISYATTSANNAQCPAGSPDWTQCGLNKPATGDNQEQRYCSQDGKFFTIGFAPAKQGKINTAFPIFE